MPIRVSGKRDRARNFCEGAFHGVFCGPTVLVQHSFSPFAGLVAMAGCPNPIPSRTRSLNASAPMVLCLKTWESRSLPGLPKAKESVFFTMITANPVATFVAAGFFLLVGSRQ